MTITLTKGLNQAFLERVRSEDAHIILEYMAAGNSNQGIIQTFWPLHDLTVSTTIKPRHEPEYLK